MDGGATAHAQHDNAQQTPMSTRSRATLSRAAQGEHGRRRRWLIFLSAAVRLLTDSLSARRQLLLHTLGDDEALLEADGNSGHGCCACCERSVWETAMGARRPRGESSPKPSHQPVSRRYSGWSDGVEKRDQSQSTETLPSRRVTDRRESAKRKHHKQWATQEQSKTMKSYERGCEIVRADEKFGPL